MTLTRFPYLLWHWTHLDESLFNLTKDQLAWFKAFVYEANKT